jgi:hypothetical protein
VEHRLQHQFEQDDAGAIKSMAPGVIIRYNTVHSNNRNPSQKAGLGADIGRWQAVALFAGRQRHLPRFRDGKRSEQSLSRTADSRRPRQLRLRQQGLQQQRGIFVFLSDNAQVYDNEVHGNGRANTGGWVEGKEGGKWLEFVGPAGYGIATTFSKNAKS